MEDEKQPEEKTRVFKEVREKDGTERLEEEATISESDVVESPKRPELEENPDNRS